MTTIHLFPTELAIEQIEIGMQVSYSHTVTDADVKAYAGLSGDNNPVHMSDEYAQNSRFKARIARMVCFRLVSFLQCLGNAAARSGLCLYFAESRF